MKNELIYGLEERPPLKDSLFAALQHLLAILVAIITPPLIVSGGLGSILRQQVFWFQCRCSYRVLPLSYSVVDIKA